MTSCIHRFLPLAALLICGSANATLIDGFGTDQATITDTVIGGPTVTTGPLPIPGGPDDTDLVDLDRSLTTELVSKDNNSDASVSLGVSGGALIYSESSNANGMGFVDWTFSPTVFDIPLTLEVEILNADPQDGARVAFLTLSLSDGVVTESVTRDVIQVLGVNTNLLSFGFTNVNLMEITSAQLMIDGTGNGGGVDLEIDFVADVPEPSVLAMLGLGLAALGWSRRRRR